MDRELLPSPLARNTVVLGDFNTYYPQQDPLYNKDLVADDLVEWITKNNLLLLNTLGTGTYYKSNMEIPIVIDLTLYIANLVDIIQDQ